ncbi:MAG: N-(5'-phosphoribosyl)anthranilate isomerase [Proteobacteria bacterium]|nr:N-(5'-phosphoribosyl)anthranilate isomerase [Pseudomonadota bacterium]
MTWVKVCGLTDDAAIEAVVEGGADAGGFVLAPGSPRCLSLPRAAELMAGVPVSRFIVTVDLSVEDAIAAAEATGADGIQAHGLHAASVAAMALEAGYLSLYPIGVSGSGLTESVRSVLPGAMPLLDTYSTNEHGGTGTPFDWTLIDEAGRPFVLAGGLGPENVARAIAAVHPFGVDASSRLESSRGMKDPSRILDFIQEAKSS